MFRFFVYSYLIFLGFLWFWPISDQINPSLGFSDRFELQFWWVNLSSLFEVFYTWVIWSITIQNHLDFLKLRVFSLCVNANFRCTRNELISTSFSTFLRSIFLLNAIIAQATVEFSDHPLFCAKSHCFRISEFEIVLGPNIALLKSVFYYDLIYLSGMQDIIFLFVFFLLIMTIDQMSSFFFQILKYPSEYDAY